MAGTHSDDKEGDDKNFALFRDCLSAVLVERLSQPAKSPATKKARRQQARARRGRAKSNSVVVDREEAVAAPVGPQTETTAVAADENGAAAAEGSSNDDAEDLAEFVDYIAAATFASLPADLRSLTHRAWADDPALAAKYPLPLTGASLSALFLLSALDPAVVDSLSAYGVTTTTTTTEPPPPPHPSHPESQSAAAEDLMAPVLTAYIESATSAPPASRASRGQATACEICARDWVDLTYHHLIPRMVHAKAVRRGWHRPEDLQNVAWLCGACHRAVHRFAGHEDLARHYFTVERLLAQDEIVAFARWVGRLRWKKK